MSYGSAGLIRQQIFTPGDTGIMATTLASPRNSNWIGCAGFSSVGIIVELTRSATTTLTCQIQCRTNDNLINVSTPVYLLGRGEVTAGSGTITTYSVTLVTAASATGNYPLECVPLNCSEFRIYQLTGASAGSGDIVSVTCVLAGQGG